MYYTKTFEVCHCRSDENSLICEFDEVMSGKKLDGLGYRFGTTLYVGRI